MLMLLVELASYVAYLKIIYKTLYMNAKTSYSRALIVRQLAYPNPGLLVSERKTISLLQLFLEIKGEVI